jgi:DNA-binding Lrp family transcriptional regulator
LTSKRDNLPLRILREVASPFHGTFGSYLRPTYSDVAKKLGIDEETARIRFRQSQRAGTILGFRLALNPHLLGRNATSVMLEADDPSVKQSMISEIKLIDEVILIMDFYDKPIRVVFCHENDRDRERRLDLIKSICGDRNPISWQMGFAPCNVKLKKTDWQILKVLSKDLMQNNSEIAKELRVSARTVRRRLAFMTESRAVYTFAVGNVMRVPGMAYLFLVNSPNEKKKRDVDEKILSKLESAVFVDTNNKQYSLYAAVFHNMGEATETHRWIKSLDGAENTRMSMIREIISVQDWFDKEIDKHLKESN